MYPIAISLLASVVAVVIGAFADVSTDAGSSPRERAIESSATLPGFVTVQPVVVAGCTAILSNDGDDQYWEGCPTNACADPANNPCDVHIGAFRIWCDCDGGVFCRAKVALNADGTVQGWLCEKVNCQPGCKKNPPPAPLPGGNRVFFYACDC